MSNFLIFLEIAVLLSVGGLLGYGAIKDIFYRSVPNSISLAIFALACISMFLNQKFVEAALIFSLVSTVSIALYWLGVFGGADAKVLMALSPMVPFNLIPLSILFLSIFLFILALFYLLLGLLQNCVGQDNDLFKVSIPFFVPVFACYIVILQFCRINSL